MRPTVHDIAATAGVSLATVDRVLNGRPGVRAVTRRKVEAAIDSLSHVFFKVIGFIVKLAPLGVLGAIAFTVGKYGVGSLK